MRPAHAEQTDGGGIYSLFTQFSPDGGIIGAEKSTERKGRHSRMEQIQTPAVTRLSLPGVAEGLGECREGVRVCLFDSIPSTNTEAKERAAAAAEGGIPFPATLLAAREQTGGRGRLGRSFYSPPDSGLYMTLALPLPPGMTADHLARVTPLAAVAARRAIAAVTGRRTQIKWVNDLYLGGRKVCGILTELAAPSPDVRVLVVGWGINLTTQHFPEGLRAPAGSLADPFPDAPPAVIDAGILCGRVARELMVLFEEMRQSGSIPADALADYRAHAYLTGKRVLCTWGGDADTTAARITATVEGIADDFSLILRKDNGERMVMGSGEVSVRESEE